MTLPYRQPSARLSVEKMSEEEEKKEQMERHTASLNQCRAEGSMQCSVLYLTGTGTGGQERPGDVLMAFPHFYLDV